MFISGTLFDDLPPENVSAVSGGGGEVSGRKRSSCDSLDEDAPTTKMTKTWGQSVAVAIHQIYDQTLDKGGLRNLSDQDTLK